MSDAAHREQADDIVAPSIIAQAYEAARVYPDLRILCPWCRRSILGGEFAEHGGWHEREEALREDVPSHWMAL